MSGFGCENISYTVVIPCSVVNSIITILNFVIVVYALRKFAGAKIASSFKIICITALILLTLTSIFEGLAFYRYAECPPTRWKSSFYNIVFFGYVLTVPFSLMAIYILLTMRVTAAFNTSAFRLSTKLTCYFYFFTIFQFIYFIVVYIVAIYFVSRSQTKATENIVSTCAFLSALWILLYIFNFVAVVCVFIKKLRYFAVSILKDRQEDQIQILNTTIKIVFCCSFAIGSSMLVIVLLIIDATLPQDYGFDLIINTFYSIDSLINGICLILQWRFSEKIYFKLCSKCDSCIKLLCKQAFVESSTKVGLDVMSRTASVDISQ